MMFMNELQTDILVVGAGASGLMAAGFAAQSGKRVVLLEHNERIGKKLFITGKGRCNLTNACPPEEVLQNIPRNGRFLYSAIAAFPPEAVMSFFEAEGCALKVERGNRVFPQSDHASSVIDALRDFTHRAGVTFKIAEAKEILLEDGEIRGVMTDKGAFYAPKVILCTGGCSYPTTGSTGDGYRMAQALGHTLIPPRGSLVPLVESSDFCRRMTGLSLRNVNVRLVNQKKKVVFEDFGELLFTHFGLSGPTILSASAHMNETDTYTVEIDLKPALDEKKLDERLLRDFEKYQNRSFENALSDLLPRSLIPIVVYRSEIPGETKVNSITKAQRRVLLELLKKFTVPVAGKRPVDEAIVTAGGIKISEVNPKTMESKLVPKLYFAGEILDIDAYTGGFNLQIAWATGRAAGLAAAEM